MHAPPLPPAEFVAIVQRMLPLLRRPATTQEVAEVFGLCETSVANLVGSLPAQACLFWEKGCVHMRYGPELLQNILASPGRTTSLSSDSSLSAPALALFQALYEDALGGTERLIEAALGLMRGGQSAGPMLLFEVSMRLMLAWAMPPQAQSSAIHEQLRRYNYICLSLMELYLLTGYRPLRKCMQLYGHAIKAARLMGDRRTRIIFDLMLGVRISLRFYRRRRSRGRDFFATALKAVEDMNDEEMTALTVDFRIIYYATCGDIHQCISAYTSRSTHVFPWYSLYIQNCSAIVSGAASVYGSRVHEGFGILESQLRNAQLAQQTFSVHWLRLQLANLLVVRGMRDEALVHLDAVANCASAVYYPVFYVLFFRTLAFYHLKNGNMAGSYAVFCQGVRALGLGAIHNVYYGYTWFFDLLYAYRKHGLRELPGYKLEEELNRAIEAPNQNLRGAALRFKALLARDGGASAQDILALLHKSYDILDKTGNLHELALTRLLLAEELERSGQLSQATTHKQLALWQLNLEASTERNNVQWESSAKERINKTATWQPDWKDHGGYYGFFTRLVQYILQSERAALFRRGTDGVALYLSGHLLTREEVTSKDFAPRLRPVQALLREGSTEAYLYGPSSLCILLKSGEVDFVIYAGNTYTRGMFRTFSREFLQVIIDYLRLHFSLALSLLRSTAAPPPQVAVPGQAQPLIFYETLSHVESTVSQAACTDAAVLILGETGVGKEVLARHIHHLSGRSGPFVPIHPASLSESLFESELFGHEKGAFTGAGQQKIGLIELAHKGTLFIDEIGEIPLGLQVKLLRVLQERVFMRVGGTRQLHADFRVISATHRNMQELIANGLFREDLYYRISVVPISLPPLRNYPERIVPLAEKFVQYFAARHHKNVLGIDSLLAARMRSYPWPGNIRELKSSVERAVILSDGGNLDILPHSQPQARQTQNMGSVAADMVEVLEGQPTLQELEKAYIAQVLCKTEHQVCGPSGAAAMLGMKRSTLYAKIREYGLKRSKRRS